MEFELSDDHRMLKELVERFVIEELMPLEPLVMAREAAGEEAELPRDEVARLNIRAKELGLYGLDAPQDVGGADLPMVALVGVEEALGRTVARFTLPPDSPNL